MIIPILFQYIDDHPDFISCSVPVTHTSSTEEKADNKTQGYQTY